MKGGRNVMKEGWTVMSDAGRKGGREGGRKVTKEHDEGR
jgi:hypothetical protein